MMRAKRDNLSGNLRAVFRDDFNGTAIDTGYWKLTNNGMTVNVASGTLTIDTGIISGAEVILQSTFTVSFNVSAYIIMTLSNRRVNQEFTFELISKDGKDSVGWLFNGTSGTTNIAFLTNNNVTTQNNVTTNNTNTSNIFEVNAYYDRCVFFSTPLADLINQRGYSYATNVPSPNKDYYIRIRAKNTGVPGGNTTFTIDAVSLFNIEESYVHIVGGRGAHILHNAVSTFGVSRNFVVFYNDSTTPLGVSAEFQGAQRNLLNPGMSSIFRAISYADQAGTLKIQQSRNGSTWYTTHSVNAVANVATILEAPVHMQYLRVVYTNGATAQTVFDLNSCFLT